MGATHDWVATVTRQQRGCYDYFTIAKRGVMFFLPILPFVFGLPFGIYLLIVMWRESGKNDVPVLVRLFFSVMAIGGILFSVSMAWGFAVKAGPTPFIMIAVYVGGYALYGERKRRLERENPWK
jgi:hypothetical protein